MPRFYFHWRGPTDCDPDPIGEELPDLVAAKAEAVKLAQAIAGDSATHHDGWSVEIADESARVLHKVPLKNLRAG